MTVPAKPAGTGIAGAMDYKPASAAAEPRCHICGGRFKGGAGYAARCLPPLVEVCSAACLAALALPKP